MIHGISKVSVYVYIYIYIYIRVFENINQSRIQATKMRFCEKTIALTFQKYPFRRKDLSTHPKFIAL